METKVYTNIFSLQSPTRFSLILSPAWPLQLHSSSTFSPGSGGRKLADLAGSDLHEMLS
jgi:hypothetical protein